MNSIEINKIQFKVINILSQKYYNYPKEDIRDIVQHYVIEKVLPLFNDKSKSIEDLTRILFYHSRMRILKEIKSNEKFINIDGENSEDLTAMAVFPLDWYSFPEQGIENAHAFETINELLNDSEREIFDLYRTGHSFREIAEITGHNIDKITKRFYRRVEWLKKKIKGK
ncbi:MAG: hypothetical protein NT007_01000 [Candidatus Kapabacteria bacterium]|nr:hypothetical protein [Candidatus Kapabacteria bacterium]